MSRSLESSPDRLFSTRQIGWLSRGAAVVAALGLSGYIVSCESSSASKTKTETTTTTIPKPKVETKPHVASPPPKFRFVVGHNAIACSFEVIQVQPGNSITKIESTGVTDAGFRNALVNEDSYLNRNYFHLVQNPNVLQIGQKLVELGPCTDQVTEANGKTVVLQQQAFPTTLSGATR